MAGIITSRNNNRASYWQVTPGGREQTLHGEEGAILGHQGGEDFWECRIGKVTSFIQLEAWILDVECGGEGTIWQTRTMVMLTKNPDGMAAYNLGWDGDSGGAPSVTQLYRCSPAAEEPNP